MARWFINAVSAGKGRSTVDSESREHLAKPVMLEDSLIGQKEKGI